MAKKSDKAMDVSKFDKNMAIKKTGENGLSWHMPYQKPFKLAGFYWFDQDKVYRRFLVKPPFPLPVLNLPGRHPHKTLMWSPRPSAPGNAEQAWRCRFFS